MINIFKVKDEPKYAPLCSYMLIDYNSRNKEGIPRIIIHDSLSTIIDNYLNHTYRDILEISTLERRITKYDLIESYPKRSYIREKYPEYLI
ncbi:hypothetical protein WCWAEYFT_CDS0015 [Vibrio phage VB_VaC_TDDLMA]